MNSPPGELQAGLLARVHAEREELVAFLSGFLAAPSPNPPGDTRAAVAYLAARLEQAGAPFRIVAPRAEMPNVVGSFECARPGRHLVLNGHVDVFPAEDAGWTHGPWSGAIADGKLWGRGATDMKCGTTASLFTYLYLHALRDRLAGRVTFTAVSDEETGGRWGSRYLLEHHADECLGDCVLNGEPGGPGTIRFAEKGTLRLTFAIRTPGAHGAYPHLSANANRIAGRLMDALDALEAIEPDLPAAVADQLARPEVRAAIDAAMGRGAADVATKVTVNIGVLRGGLKVNMLPGECTMEVDVRLPPGLDKSVVKSAIEAIVARHPGVDVAEQEAASNPSSWCDPNHEMVELVADAAEIAGRPRPVAIPSLGATDCKFWRYRGVPAYVYGCLPGNMGTRDEAVPVEDFLHVVRVHALAACAYLHG